MNNLTKNHLTQPHLPIMSFRKLLRICLVTLYLFTSHPQFAKLCWNVPPALQKFFGVPFPRCIIAQFCNVGSSKRYSLTRLFSWNKLNKLSRCLLRGLPPAGRLSCLVLKMTSKIKSRQQKLTLIGLGDQYIQPTSLKTVEVICGHVVVVVDDFPLLSW